MKKEKFLEIINNNVKDPNKKVKFIFTSPYSRLECYLTTVKIYKYSMCLSNYYPPKLDEPEKQLAYEMINIITNSLQDEDWVSFVIYFDENRNNYASFYNYKMTVNESDDFIELIIQK